MTIREAKKSVARLTDRIMTSNNAGHAGRRYLAEPEKNARTQPISMPTNQRDKKASSAAQPFRTKDSNPRAAIQATATRPPAKQPMKNNFSGHVYSGNL